MKKAKEWKQDRRTRKEVEKNTCVKETKEYKQERR
jgi:hypothetical protein